MLRLFLRARIVARRNVHGEAPAEARRAVSKVIRREARVTRAEFDMAVSGRLHDPQTRARIWGALGHVVDLSLSRAANPPAAGGALPGKGPDGRSALPALPEQTGGAS